MTTVFDVIADPTRREILGKLLQRPHSVGELADELAISQPGVSKQLRLLREAGLVQYQRKAQVHWYYLEPEPLKELDSWLEAYRKLWSDRYDQLDDYLKTIQRKENETNDD
jgi:DNA-binding transcriptional ArsR family regulator